MTRPPPPYNRSVDSDTLRAPRGALFYRRHPGAPSRNVPVTSTLNLTGRPRLTLGFL